MKRCVKIFFDVDEAQKILETFIAKQSHACKLEGVGQQIKKGSVQLFVCGQEERVDDFIDALYVGSDKVHIKNIMIETCTTERSFRGVFRIVE